MMNLGAKLHINVNDMVTTIKRGLLDSINAIDQTSTIETLCIEENTKTSPSCSQQLFRIIFAGDNSSKAFYIGQPVATIVIFIAGIVCSLTIELLYMNTGMFVFNSSAIHHSL